MHQKTTAASRDLILICFVAILAYVLSSFFHVFDTLLEWLLQQHERLWALDEIVTVVVVLAFAFGFFSLRRWRELRTEVAACKRSEGDLKKDQEQIEEKVRERAAELKTANAQLQREVEQRELVEKALRDSEEKYRILVESATDMIYMIDRGHKVLSLNKAGAMLWGKEPREIVGKSIFQLFPEEIAAQYAKGLEEVFQTGRSRSTETRMIGGGRESWISVSLNPVKDHEGRIVAVMGIARDITEHKRAEEEICRLNQELEQRVIERTAELKAANKKLEAETAEHKRAEEAVRESEERYRALVENQGEGIGVVDPEERFVFVNSAGERIFGVPRGSLIGRSLKEFTSPEQFGVVGEETAKRRKGEKSTYELEIIRMDGERSNILVTAAPRFDSNGQFTGAFGVFLDITERRRAEEALRESEEKYRSLVERANDGIVIVQDGIIKFMNAHLAGMKGVTVDEVIGTPFTDHIYPDELPGVVDRYKRRMAGEDVPAIYATVLLRKDGSKIHAELNAGVVTYQGKPADLVIVRDITERVNAEKVLIESEQRYRAVMEQTAEGIYLADGENKRILEANTAFQNLLGYTSEEILRLSLYNVIAHDRESIDLRVRQLAIEKRPIFSERQYLRKDGSIVQTEDSAGLISYDGREVLCTIVRDITERKRAEEAIRKSELLFRLVWENSADGMRLTDEHGTVLMANKAFCRMVGKRKEAIEGKSLSVIYTEERQAHILRRHQERFNSRTVNAHFERELILWDGKKVWFEVSNSFFELDGQVPLLLSIFRDITERKRAEKVLLESEDKFRSIVETTNEWIWEIDLEGRHIYSNPAMEKILGYCPEEFIGIDCLSFMHEEDRAEVEKRLPSFIEGKRGWTGWVLRWLHKDGSYRYLESNAVPILNKDGELLGFRGADRNITERKQVEESLRESEERFRRLSSATLEGVAIHDEGKILDANQSMSTLFGYELSEIVGMNALQLAAPESRDVVMRNILSDDERPYEAIGLKKDGSTFVAELVGRAIPFRGHMVRVKVIRDITERKRIEQDREVLCRIGQDVGTTANLDELLQRIHQNIKKVMYAENCYVALYDPGTEIVSFPFFVDQFDPTPLPRAKRRGLTEYVLRTGKPFLLTTELFDELVQRNEVELIGTPPESWLGVPLVIQNRLIGVLVVQSYETGHKYTERDKELLAAIGNQAAFAIKRKEAEDTLQRSEEQYRLIAENTHDLICVLDQEANLMYASPSFNQALGWKPQELMVGSFFSLVHPDDAVRAARTLPRALFSKNGRTVELRYRHQNGEWRIFESVWSWIFDENQSPQRSVVVSRDITERRRAEQALRESEEKYRTLFEESLDAIYISTPDGKLVDISPAGVELFGYPSKEELLQVDVRRLYSNPVDRAVNLRAIEQQGFVKDFELVLKRKDGQKLIVLDTVTAVRDDKGNIVAYRGIMRDVTKQKQLEQQFLQAQKMESVGRLAGGVAHDFNNVLTAIMGSAELVSRSTAGDEKLSHYVSIIKQAARRGGDLAKQLLTFARLDTYTMKPVDVNEVLEETIKLVERTFEKSIEVKTRFASGIPLITGDAGRLEQVFMNLCVNARDAMPNGGTLTIETRHASVDDAVGQESQHFSSGDYVEVSVSDTGVGMDDKTQQHMFEPFYTTKERDKGTGLGLAVVYGIVQTHKGFLMVESTVGVGTTFRIYLPVSDYQRQSEIPAEELHREHADGKGIVLIVDDDKMVQDLTEEMLTALGYHALKVGSGEECIEVYRGRGKEINLVILDLAMGKMNGEETFRQLRVLDGDVKVLVASGLTELEPRRRMEEAGIVGFLQKPYQMSELAIAIQAAMK